MNSHIYSTPVFKSNLIFLLILAITTVCFADRVRYNGKVDIYDTSGEYIAHHFHSWIPGKDYGKVELIKNGEILFFKETGAFTYVKLFVKQQMIVLLSKIKVNNPYQIEIIDFNCNVLFKKSIAPDSFKRFRDYGISESVTNYTFWYNDTFPKVMLIDSNNHKEIKVKTPNDSFVSFDIIQHNLKKKGVAGIGYGAGYGKGINPDSLINSLIDSADSITKSKFSGSDSFRNKSAPDYVKGGSLKGSRPKRSIMKTVMLNLAPLRSEYQQRLKVNPKLKGKITFKFGIISSGEVIYCKLVEATLMDKVMQRNIENLILKWDFDKIESPNDTTVVTYPFVFSQ